MTNKTAKEVFKTGQMKDLTEEHVIEIIGVLYEKHLAGAWFIGMGWIEGYVYCQNPEFLKSWANAVVNGTEAHNLAKRRAVWFACTFL